MSISDPVVSLNVGGHIYTTARSTLTRYRDSMLGAMFGGDFDTAARDDQGRYFIDRNGRLFEHVLNFLRTSQLVLPEDFKELPLLEMEADFYQIQPLIEALVQRSPNDVVSLNVGGHFYTTTRGTLTRYPDSKLGNMFRQDDPKRNRHTPTYACLPALWDERGRLVIDRDGMIFRHVLNFLRLGQLALPEGFKELSLLEIEAEFYQLQEMVEAVGIMMGKSADDEHDAYGYGYYDD